LNVDYKVNLTSNRISIGGSSFFFLLPSPSFSLFFFSWRFRSLVIDYIRNLHDQSKIEEEEDAERSEGGRGRRKRIANESKQTQHSFGFIRLLGSSDQPFPTLT